MNKTIKIVVASVGILVLVFGGWQLFQSSEKKRIEQIETETKEVVDSYGSSTQRLIKSPLTRKDLSGVSNDYQTTIDIIGTTFQVPWERPSSVDDRGTAAELTFPEGQRITIMKAPSSSTPQKSLQEFDKDMPATSTKSLTLFNQELGKNFSGFDFFKYVLNTTPEDVSNADNLKEAKARARAIILKRGVAAPISTNPQLFQTENVQGFQFGFPDQESPVYLQLMAKNHQSFYDIIIAEGASKKVVDAIISTTKIKDAETPQPTESDKFFSE